MSEFETIIEFAEGSICVDCFMWVIWVPKVDPSLTSYVIGWIEEGTLTLEPHNRHWHSGMQPDEWERHLVKLLRLAGYEVNL